MLSTLGLISGLLHPKRCCWQLSQSRGVKLFEIFSREKTAERKQRLKEDIDKGYFDDFGQMKTTHGKIFPAQGMDASKAPLFPKITVHAPDGSESQFPPEERAEASLICLAFRSGAEDSLTSWRRPFQQHFHSSGKHAHVALYELALIDSQVMSIWPFRQLILSGGGRQQQAAAAAGSAAAELPATALWYFHDVRPIIRAIGCTNKLTGYAYLVDKRGRIRWRASGQAQPDELHSLLQTSDDLVSSQGLD
ncbi:hypothetical protein WJX84_005808 [Apatococcus fuscideae]|uniref:Mitochondrial ATPase complex subunit ATP10 n=1 Tax=Apatococcus fuscideae TaxID=2026836 RepID=A0AAW1T8L7_9CHLO